MNVVCNNLLIPSGVKTGLIAAVCVLAAALIVYGAIRRFSRSSWTGFQIVVIFFVSVGISKINPFGSKIVYFGAIAGILFACIAAVAILGGILRWVFRTRTKKPNWFFRVFNRILGSVNAIVNVAVPVVAIGGMALTVIYYCTSLPQGALSAVYGNRIWEAFGKYAPDLLLIAFLTIAVKGGYKLGLLKSIWTVMMMILTVLALVGSVYIAIRMPGISSLSVKLSASFAGSMNAVLARILGYGIVSLVAFVVLIVVIVLLNLLINLGVREMDKIRVVRFFDGALFAVIVFAVSIALVSGTHFAVYSIAHASLPQTPPVAASLAEEAPPEEAVSPDEEQTPPEQENPPVEEGTNWLQDIWGEVVSFFVNHNIEGMFTSAPMSNIFYTYNPIFALTGNG